MLSVLLFSLSAFAQDCPPGVVSICSVVANDSLFPIVYGGVPFAETTGAPAIKATCGDITYCE